MALLDTQETAAVTSLVFGDYELRLDSGELLRSGVAVKLQPRPARVLAVLALKAGTAVSREEIRNAVWGAGSHVDFDLSLNYCIRQIRLALDDTAEEPRFVVTLPRVGYRFLFPVETRRREPAPPLLAAPAPAPPSAPAASRNRWPVWRRIAAAALAVLTVGSLVALRSRREQPAGPTIPAEATRAYLEGQYFSDHNEHDKARDAFQRVTTLAPTYAPGWAAMAHELLEWRQHPAREMVPILQAAERRALELDPQLSLAHLNRAIRLFRYEYDWQGAEKEFRQALDLDPQDPDAHYEYAMLLAARGRHDEALKQVDMALYLKPEKQLVRTRHPWFYYLARRYDEAITQARHQIALAPGTTSETNPTQPELYWAFRTILLSSLAKGDQAAAFEAARAEAHWLGEPEPASVQAFWTEKERISAKVGLFRPWSGAVLAIELGHRDRAMDLLFQICRERSDSMIPFLRVDPLYDSLRNHPRYPELLRCANLTDES